LAKVTPKGASIQKLYGGKLSGLILADFVSADGKNPSLKRSFDEHIKETTGRLTELVARAVQEDVRKHYNGALSEVQTYLKVGIGGAPSGHSVDIKGVPKLKAWAPLTDRYYKSKLKANRNSFWKNRASKGLSGKFGSFAGTHKSAVTNTTTVVNLVEKGRVNSNKVFRYRFEFSLPTPHVGDGYFKELLQDSFFNATPYEGKGYGLDESTPLAILGYIEGAPSANRLRKHRPFIARLMAARGQAFLEKTNFRIKNQVI